MQYFEESFVFVAKGGQLNPPEVQACLGRKAASMITTKLCSKTQIIPCPTHLKDHLCSSDSTTLANTTLSRAQVSLLASNNSLRLLNNLLTLGQDQLDVTWV